MERIERDRRLFEILKVLASSSKKALTIKCLMKCASYKDRKKLNIDLQILKKQGLVEFRYSGFPSDRLAHHKIVVLQAEPLIVHSEMELEEETEITEETKVVVVSQIDVNSPFELVKIRAYGTPSGPLSYMTLQDFLRLPKEEREAICDEPSEIKKRLLTMPMNTPEDVEWGDESSDEESEYL